MGLAFEDTAELVEVLQFIAGWLAHDSELLGPSFARWVGSDGYDLAEMRRDLDRFVFLLGGADGAELFGPEPG